MTKRDQTADRYYAATGETVGRAVARIHKTMSVQHAAHYIGFLTATELRKYLSRRGLPDPWPMAYRGKRRCRVVTEEAIIEYCRRVSLGEPRGEVEKSMGYGDCTMRQCLRRAGKETAARWWAAGREAANRGDDN